MYWDAFCGNKQEEHCSQKARKKQNIGLNWIKNKLLVQK